MLNYEITWKWVPLQIFGMGISIGIMMIGAGYQPSRCPAGLCNPYLAFLLQAIGFLLFVLLGYSLMKMNFGPLLKAN